MTDQTIAALEKRLRALESVAAIKTLQESYWKAIDLKQPDDLRDLFAEGEIHIDFEDMPVWRSRDEFVRFFIELGLNPMRQENHFGLNPRIDLKSEDSAVAYWRLNMFAYDYEQRILVRITGEYDCKYSFVGGTWKITSMIFRRHSLFSEKVGEAGEMTALSFGGVSPESASYLFGSEDAADN